mgnify:CR=1 FL=1
MKRNARTAYDTLKKMGVPMYIHEGENYHFLISAEDNTGDELWADFYDGRRHSSCDDFGVNKKINAVLDKHDLFAEWKNPGCLGVYDS